MKNPFILCIGLPVLLSCILYSCAEPGIMVETYVKLTDCGEICSYLKKTDSLNISRNCANCLIDNFEKNGFNFPAASDGTPIRGFQMRNEEINDFFIDIGYSSTSDSAVLQDSVDIYGMFGVYYGKKSESSSDTVSTFHQVFLVQNNSDTANIEIKYYNFVRPCPNFCPALIPEE